MQLNSMIRKRCLFFIAVSGLICHAMIMSTNAMADGVYIKVKLTSVKVTDITLKVSPTRNSATGWNETALDWSASSGRVGVSCGKSHRAREIVVVGSKIKENVHSSTHSQSEWRYVPVRRFFKSSPNAMSKIQQGRIARHCRREFQKRVKRGQNKKRLLAKGFKFQMRDALTLKIKTVCAAKNTKSSRRLVQKVVQKKLSATIHCLGR